MNLRIDSRADARIRRTAEIAAVSSGASVAVRTSGLDMSETQSRPKGPWTADELAREAAATAARSERDRKAGAAENVRAAALARFANRVADAAAAARRDGRARS